MPLFWPWETYKAGVSLDLSKHHIIKTFLDKFAFKTVKTSENSDIPTFLFPEKVWFLGDDVGTVAVPLLQFQHSGGWIKSLLEEAENERMHLMTTVDPVQLIWYERFLVLTVQGVFVNAFFVMYLLSPKLARIITGYLEEVAVHSYTKFLKEIDSGKIENVQLLLLQ